MTDLSILQNPQPVGYQNTPGYSPDYARVDHVHSLNEIIGNYAHYRNALINGGMEIHQRGSALTLAGVGFGADRWDSFLPTTGRTIVRLFNFSRDTSVWMRLQRNSGNSATDQISIGQTLETYDSIRFRGKQVTVSFRALPGPVYTPGKVKLTIYGGTGVNQPSRIRVAFTGDTVIATKDFSLTPGDNRYSLTTVIPSTITQLAVVLDTTAFVGTAPADDCVDVTNFQLEEGPVPTPFERRHIQTELALCQRYYERASTVAETDITNDNPCVYWKVTKRVAPTLSVLAIQAGVGATWTNFPAGYDPESGFYQNANNSVGAVAIIGGDAELV